MGRKYASGPVSVVSPADACIGRFSHAVEAEAGVIRSSNVQPVDWAVSGIAFFLSPLAARIAGCERISRL